MKNMLLVSCVVAAAGFLGACDTVKAPSGGKRDPVPMEAYPKVTVQSDLAPFLAFTEPTVRRGDVMGVTTPVRAQTDGQELNVQYRYIFFDASGRPLRVQPDWKYVRLPSRQQVFLESNSLDSTAADWRLEVRPAR